MKLFNRMMESLKGMVDGKARLDALERFKSAMAGHKPGRMVRLSDGTTYRVQASGAWKRTSERACNLPGNNGEILNKSKHRRLA